MTPSRPRPRPQPRRAALLMLPSALAVAVAAAEVIREVRNSTPGNPDPGNRLLNALAADPVFAALPPGAVRTSRQEKPTTYSSGGIFESGEWAAPTVIMTFTSARSVRDVYGFYAERAHDAGWTPSQWLPAGFADIWAKKIATQQSYITLMPESFDIGSINVAESGTPRSYSLST